MNKFVIPFKERKAKIVLVCVGIFILLFITSLMTLRVKKEKVFQFSANSTTMPYEVNLYDDRSTVIYDPEKGWILRSYSPQDHVVTPFLPVDSNIFYKKDIHVEFLFPSDSPSERRPMVYLQKSGYVSFPAVVAYNQAATGNSFILEARLYDSDIRVVMVPQTGGQDVVLPEQIILSSEASLIKVNEIFDFVKSLMLDPQMLAQLFMGCVLTLTIAGFCVYKKLGHLSFISPDQSSTALNTHRPYLALIAVSCVISSLIHPFFWEAGKNVDPFIYLAYQLHFPEYYKEIFPETYYGARLGANLIGYLAHKIFPPVFAQFALTWFKSFLGAFSLYAFLVRIRGHLAATLTAILFSLWPWVEHAMSSLYVDGYGIAYYLLTATLIMQARHSAAPKKLLFAGGICVGLVFSTYTFCVLHCIPLIVFYMYDGRQKTCRHYVHDFAFLTSWMGFGFIMLLCAFGLLSRAFGGSFLFFIPLFRVILELLVSNPYAPTEYSWLRTAYWLDVQFIAIITAVIGLVVWLIHRRHSKKNWELSHTVSLVCVMTFLLHCLFGDRGMSLKYFFYSSYLFGISFLTLGCYVRIEKKSTLILALCIISLALIGARYGVPVFSLGQPILVGLSVMALLCALISAGIFVWFSRTGVFIMTVYLCWAAFYSGHYTLPRQFLQGRTDYNRLISVNDYIRTHVDNKNVRFWYDQKESYVYINHASMYLWGYRLIGTSFPELLDWAVSPTDMVQIRLPPPGTDVVVMSKGVDAVKLTQDIFAQHGIAAALYSERSFGNYDDMYTVFIFRTSILSDWKSNAVTAEEENL